MPDTWPPPDATATAADAATLELLATNLLDPTAALPPGLIRTPPGHPAMAALRWSVYRNNVQHSLAQALADTFEVVQSLVGPDFFRTAALQFLRCQPPQSPLLRRYGRRFPAFLRRYRPAAGLPYLADVARLEWLHLQALHAPDVAERQIHAARSQLAVSLADPATLPGLRLRLLPSVQLINSPHPVVSIWAAHQGRLGFDEIDAGQGEAALLLRDNDEVLLLPIDAASWRFLHALHRGRPLGEAMAAAARGQAGDAPTTHPAGHPAADPAFNPAPALGLLLHHGTLRRVLTPAQTH